MSVDAKYTTGNNCCENCKFWSSFDYDCEGSVWTGICDYMLEQLKLQGFDECKIIPLADADYKCEHYERRDV